MIRETSHSPPITSLNAENRVEKAVMVALLFADFKRAIKVLLDANGKPTYVRLFSPGND